MSKYLVWSFLIMCHICFARPGGKLLIKNYNQLEIGTESGVFWSVIKDKRGVLYFGGEGEVIEFDGISWRGIPMPNHSAVRSLAADTSGTIYVGGVGEFGYLLPNDLGKLEYISLVAKIPKNKLLFSDVWSIVTIGEKVYFQSDNRMFCYEGGQIKTWDLKNSYHRSFAINNQIFFNQRGIGLCRLSNDSIEILPRGDFFKDMVISSMFVLGNNKILLGTRTNGLYTYETIDKERAGIFPFECDVNDILKENHIYHGLNMPDGRMIFSTLHAGIFIVDENGKILSYINKSTGFIDYSGYFINVFNDYELWIASSKGVSYHNINSPISYWNDELGIKGFVNTITKHGNKIYIGTNAGLFTLDYEEHNKPGFTLSPTPFKLINNMNSEVWQLLKFDPAGNSSNNGNTYVLAATGEGLYDIGRRRIVFDKKVNGMVTMCQSRKRPDILYYNTHPTFYILQYINHTWEIIWQKNISSYVHSIVEDIKGNVWIGTRFYGVYRIDLEDFHKNTVNGAKKFQDFSNTEMNISHFNTLSGLPNLNLCLTFMYNNNLVVSCNGLYTFNELENRFVRAEIFGEEIKNWDKTPNALKADIYGNIWGIDTEVLDKQADGSFKITSLPYQMLAVKNSTLDYYNDKNGCTWIGGEQGLFKYDSKAILPKQKTRFQTLIRKVILNNDSTIFYGTNYVYNEQKKNTSFVQPENLIPEFPVKNKTISFEYSCPYFQDDIPLKYSYFLEGYDEKWSEWSHEYKKEYNNLRENKYVFHVRARNSSGVISEEASFIFIITPPWHRTLVAYISYILAFILIIYVILKVNSYRLRRYNIILEKTVNERTLMLEKQKEEINIQAIRLKEQNEKLVHQKNIMTELSKEIKETNKNKLKFFTNISHELRTPLTLILGPVNELLSAKAELAETERSGFYKIIQKNASRLLNLVNQILDFRKLEMQAPRLEAFENDIVCFIEDVASYFRELAEKKEIEYVFEPEMKELKTWYDPDKVEKIVVNLISNAFKYTPHRGKIHIKLRLVENHIIKNYQGKVVEISIKDTGIGIAEDVIPKIFDRYYHSGKSISFNQAGSGIGLSLAAKLVEVHHGGVSVESKVNEGSTFYVALPFGKDYLRADEMKNSIRDKTERETITIDTSDVSEKKYIHKTPKEIVEGPGPDPNKDLVLIVEDSEDIRTFIKSSLGKKYGFIEAENGVEGIRMAEKYIPDLIITDIMMPQMDGYEFCAAVKSKIETSHIPVIMLTSKSGALSQKMGLEHGADDYISKPFDINLLDLRMSNLIKSRVELRKRFSKEIVVRPSDVVINSTDEKFLTKAIKTVENHMSDLNYDIEEFSRDMAMSQSTLYRKLKALTGESTNNFIKDLRLNRGASLLAQNEISVSEIANMVGFDDPAYFSKSFKQKFGTSPTDYSKKFL